MPVQYESIVAEHLATRQVAGLFDVSHMGRVFVEGPQALSWLEGLLTRRVADLAVGRARYTLVTGVDGTAVKEIGTPVILDDALARRVAETLKIPHTGTLGLLISAKTAGLITAVGPYLDQLERLHFHLATQTKTAVLKLAGEQ